MSRLTDAASFGRQSSYTLGEAVRSATEGLKNENSILVDNAGVTKNVAKMWDDYARSIGKNRNQLTQQEKIQAEVNGILKETQFQVGDAAKYTKTYAGRLAVLGKALQDVKVNIGNAFKPGAGGALEGLTEQLSAIKRWTEANQATMQHWSQAIANTVKIAVKGFKFIAKAIAENWGVIKFAGLTLLTYTALTKGAAAATTAWRITTLALKGELMTQVPILSTVSAAIGTYRLQMALAPVATNIFAGALLKLRVALYAVHTAMGPIGWAILALSAAISGGMGLWSKYGQSLQNTASYGFGDFRNAQESLAKSTGTAAEASEDQADAIDKAGKAAKKSLVGFDEINQLQKDMSEGGGDGEDAFDNLELGGAMPGLNMDQMLSELEQVKPTFAGFWEWIKNGAGNIWECVKVKWGGFTDWVGDKWGSFKASSAQIWDSVKTGVQNSWEALKTNASTAWDNIKSTLESSWDAISTRSKETWETIKNSIQTSWDTLKKDAPVTWENIKRTVTTAWEGTKTSTGEVWNTIKNELMLIWNDLKIAVETTFNGIKTSVGTIWGNIKTTLSNNWDAILNNAGTTFSNIKNTVLNAFTEVKANIGGIWDDIWTTMKTYINKIISGLNTMIRGMNKLKWEAPDWVPVIGGKSWGLIYQQYQH
jgi:hypothetical protein